MKKALIAALMFLAMVLVCMAALATPPELFDDEEGLEKYLEACQAAEDEDGFVDFFKLPREYWPERLEGLVLPPLAFDGTTWGLEDVQFAPTFDTVMESAKNVLWCATFELAWRQLIDEVLKEPVKLDPPSPVADRLNASKTSSKQIPEGQWFAAAGFEDEGVLDRISQGLAAFPGAQQPDLSEYVNTGDLITYSYLATDVRFKPEFSQHDDRLIFTSSDGSKHRVKAFGLTEEDSCCDDQHESVRVLYCSEEGSGQPREFALDLCHYSKPSQVVIACVEPAGTLEATVASVEEKIANWHPDDLLARKLSNYEQLLVPDLGFRLLHSYKELLLHVLANPGKGEGLSIVRAEQLVNFRLTKYGAVLSSYSMMIALGYERGVGRSFYFDKPFLVYMKKRGEKTPYFAMWVADATFMYQGSNTSQAP